MEADLTRSEAIAPRPGPSDLDVARREVDLARLARAVAEREAAWRAYEAELEAFRRRYLTAFGAAFAELDDLEAKIAVAAAEAKPADNAKRNKAERVQARLAPRGGGEGGELPATPKAKPADELRALFRSLTKQIHPDLADDDEERERRAALMVAANAAYAAGDHAALAAIATREGAPAAAEGPLARLDRQMADAEARLAALDARRAAAEASELARLMRRTAKAAEDGRDLFRKFAAEVEEELKHARKRLRALTRRAGKRAGGAE